MKIQTAFLIVESVILLLTIGVGWRCWWYQRYEFYQEVDRLKGVVNFNGLIDLMIKYKWSRFTKKRLVVKEAIAQILPNAINWTRDFSTLFEMRKKAKDVKLTLEVEILSAEIKNILPDRLLKMSESVRSYACLSWLVREYQDHNMEKEERELIEKRMTEILKDILPKTGYVVTIVQLLNLSVSQEDEDLISEKINITDLATLLEMYKSTWDRSADKEGSVIARKIKELMEKSNSFALSTIFIEGPNMDPRDVVLFIFMLVAQGYSPEELMLPDWPARDLKKEEM